MNYKATITVKGDSELINRVFSAEDRQIREKASYNIKKIPAGLVFEVTADNSTDLRTVLNSITKVLTVIEQAKKL